MDSIEAEALRRAQEMHSNNQKRNNPYPYPPAKNPQRKADTPQSSNRNKQKDNYSEKENYSEEEIKKSMPSKSEEFPVAALFEDKEKLLILVLILILISEENSDPATVLALLYLII